jgi:hypothetical protein
VPPRQVARQGRDAPAERLVQQEVLAEGLPRFQPVARDRFA